MSKFLSPFKYANEWRSVAVDWRPRNETFHSANVTTIVSDGCICLKHHPRYES